ncbi:MAG TPA: phosphatidylserine/phosphatidylglycerophosphate/cardiolipin synthase family protein [Rhizomicrobium sp.]|nr:phosphatidylserine/phosphatidylglycerophosphate/cardiolipin synthase family protein [Rhizomicrobium sp.]
MARHPHESRPERGNARDGVSASVALPSHIPSIHTGSYPVRAGNLVVPLIDGETAFGRICEAVASAEHSVWVTVAYLDPAFRMPGAHGSFFDVLDRAKARAIDVRVIFWRAEHARQEHFHGSVEDHDWLKQRGSKFLARWDRAHKTYCHHQKSWLIDAGHDSEIAFVGGINLMPGSTTARGHTNRDGRHTHDVYCEIRGPSATDVHHNFVQRWNEAGERQQEHGVWPAGSHTDSLAFPQRTSQALGDSIVQMQRTIRAGHYTDGHATPGGQAFEIANGEHTILDQYLAAIAAARETIYIEDQYIASPDVVVRLRQALERGVDVTFLCPADPEQQVKDARHNPVAKPFYDLIGSLGEFPNFLLAGLASPRTGAPIYVHDKIMLVDDVWATIGSCNIASQSFYCDSELNAAIWDETVVTNLRDDLFSEHIASDTAGMSARDAMAHYRKIACANASKRENGEAMTGLAFALDPREYGAN